jgi:hypothetical protein
MKSKQNILKHISRLFYSPLVLKKNTHSKVKTNHLTNITFLCQSRNFLVFDINKVILNLNIISLFIKNCLHNKPSSLNKIIFISTDLVFDSCVNYLGTYCNTNTLFSYQYISGYFTNLNQIIKQSLLNSMSGGGITKLPSLAFILCNSKDVSRLTLIKELRALNIPIFGIGYYNDTVGKGVFNNDLNLTTFISDTATTQFKICCSFIKYTIKKYKCMLANI